MKLYNKKWLTALVSLLGAWNGMAQTTQVKGLTVIVEFLNAPFTNPVDSVAGMMNTPGFNGWGNTGSVRDFYYGQTNSKYLITSEVIKVSLPYYSSDYYGSSATRHDVPDIIAAINAKYPNGFQNLTIDPADGKLMVFTILTKAGGGAWSFGQQDGNTFIKNNGVNLQVGDGNVTNYGLTENPDRNTICHEMGHAVFGWPDLYNMTESNGNSNLGHYCVMGSGGSKYNASPISAPLRHRKGWIPTVTELPNTTTTYTITSNSRTKVFKYTNPNNAFEYFLIEALYVNGDYPAIDGDGYTMDQGLAVWYVDEQKAGFNPDATPNNPRIKLIQADGLDEMHDMSLDTEALKFNLRGDLNDLFDNQFSTLSAATHPFFRWKDGSEPGLTITNISAPGATMQFTVQARPNTVSAQSTYSNGGTISPKGLLSYATGSSKTVTIVPELGYQISNVLVDNVSQGAITSYTFSSAGNHTISATFQASTSADPVPSPWQEIEIGNTRKAGAAGHRNGVFGLESSHYDIYNTEDGLTFIYQPITGNGEIVAKVASMNFPHEWSKAGIMMRESLSPGSKHFMLARTPGNNLAPQYRPSTGGESFHNPQGTDIKEIYYKYQYLKIVRSGSTFTSYCSQDGVSNWVQLATYNISMSSTIYVGLCASAGTDVLATKVTFSNVSVMGGNPAPTVSITAPANNASFAAPASVTITANAADANGTVSKVEFFQGSTKLGEDASSPYSFAWTGVAAGTYSLTAKATDNGGASTTSTAVTVVVNGTVPSNDFCFEAESALGQSAFAPFQVVNDASAAGGKYIVVPNGTGNVSSQPSNSIASFSFTVPTTATYYFWVRVIATSSNDNSMWIRTDANSFETWTPGTYTAWTWKKWTPSTSSSLSAGSHSISVARNEDGLRIDKIIVSKSSSAPTGFGCGASARMEEEEGTEMSIEAENQLLVAPNPSSDAFSLVSVNKPIAHLSVSNALGTNLFSSKYIQKGSRVEFGSEFESGMYIITVHYEDGQKEVHKVIKTR